LVEVWGKDGESKATIGGNTVKIPTQGGFKNPHSLRAGMAWSTLDDKLLLALDLKYLLYKPAFDRLKQIRKASPYDKDAPWETSYTPAYWKNSWVVQVGAEYKAADAVALRTGYTILETATNPDYAPAFMAPAGLSHLVTAGLGFKVLDSLNLDLAAGYVMVKGQVNKATMYNAGVGEYSSRGGELSLQAHYHY
jgi:long-subunit fatty acid transport protein